MRDRYRFLPTYRYYDVTGTNTVTLSKSAGKPLRDYKIYGNIDGVGDFVTNTTDVNYGKYKLPIMVYGKNYFGTIPDITNFYRRPYASVIEKGDNYVILKGSASSSETGTPLYVNGWFSPLADITNVVEPTNINFNVCDVIVLSCYYTVLEADANFNGIVGMYLVSKDGNTGLNSQAYNVKIGVRQRLSMTYTVGNVHTNLMPQITVNSSKVLIEDIQIYNKSTESTYNIYLDEPLMPTDYADYKNQCVVTNQGTTSVSLPKISTQKYINSIYVNTTIAPSSMTVTYYK